VSVIKQEDFNLLLVMMGLLFLFLVLGMPIAFTIGFPSILYIIIKNPEWLTIIPSRLFSGMNVFVFLAIPFFVMTGEIMSESKITERIIRFTDSLVGHVRGGLAQVNVVSSMFFAGISGAALSDIAALGSVFIPAMEKNGYERKFAAAITATSSIQGPIIPPSIIIVIYAAIMGTSVGALFAAGIIPGVLIGVTDCLIVAVKAKKRGYPKRGTKFSLKEVGTSFVLGFPALILPGIILGGIMGGVFTPTEAGAVAVFYGLLLGFFLLRTLKLGAMVKILRETMIKTGVLFIIVAFAKIFSWVLAMEDVPQLIGEVIFGWTDNVIFILFIMNIIFLFVGTWLETGAAIILLGPVFGPALVNLGVHPVHLGMVMIVNLTIGLITPPFGVCLYAASSISGCTVEEISKEAFPYIMLDIGVLFLITYFPSIVLYFPKLFGLA
jgi:tripartite ATP-independent transporter DctM subunit